MVLAEWAALALVIGLGYAAWEDWRTREVRDGLWQGLALLGLVLGAVDLAPSGPVALGTWLLVGLFMVQHLVGWDAPIGRRWPELPFWLEVAMYAGVLVIVAALVLSRGLGGGGVPFPVLALLATVLLARGLFEVGVLYGGADAKALMVAGILVPVFTDPLLPLPANARLFLDIYPYSVNLLMDAALLSLAVPVALALLNLRAHRFRFTTGFTCYPLPTERLSQEFVWLKEPALPSPDPEPETSEQDLDLRRRQQAELTARGVREVLVTPQLPFVVLLAVGAVVALLAGNLLFDLVAAL